MREYVLRIFRNPLISGSVITFLGFLSGNFFNFLFNVYMSRSLSVAEYGTFASIVSIILLYSFLAESFIPTVVHFASTYFANGEIDKSRGLFIKVTKLALGVGSFGFLIFIVFSKSISDFFNIQNENLLIFVGFTMLFAFTGAVNRAFLQAKLAFSFITYLSIFSSTFKLLIGVVLVFLGLGVYGAVWAFFLEFFIQYLIMLVPLRTFFSKKGESKMHILTLLAYGAPTTLTLLGFASFITADIILVKHFFSARDAGIYAGLSLLGRVIYFFSAPIITVMFPLIVQRHARNETYTHVFKTAVFFTFISSIFLTAFYSLFPELCIRILLRRDEYLVLKPLLWYFGLYMIVYSLLSVLINFFLSVKKTKIYIPVVISAFLQVLILVFFHRSMQEVISVSLSVTSLLLLVLLLYYFMLYGSKTKNK